MIQKNDLIILLSNMEEQGIDIGDRIEKVLQEDNYIDLDTLKFINDNRHLDVTNFYEKLRQSYNKKKSDLYINIVRDVEKPEEVIITLASFVLQALLFARNVEDKVMFIRHIRLEECSRVINLYSKTFDLTNAIKLIQLIKADLLACETISGRRE